MKKGKTVRDHGDILKMMKFVLEGLLILRNYPFIIHILITKIEPFSASL